MENIQIIPTADGSHTLFNARLNETYHSSHGALTESLHVFVKNGLEYFVLSHPKVNHVKVFEMGFGTGLNAALACRYSRANAIRVDYETIEAFPVDAEVISSLNYFDRNTAEKNVFMQIHSLSWDVFHRVSETFAIKKILGKIEDHHMEPDYFNVIFYDAFAPGKQEEVWSPDVLEKVIISLADDGVFVTYCAKGQLKRDLKALGCEVQTLQGPPGKKEMVRAIKMNKYFQE